MEEINSKTQSLEGRKFKFTINSAEEAVKMIREHLGEKARVLSVNQVGGTGFSRFLSSPKLEVIAMIPPKEESEQKEQKTEPTPAPKEKEEEKPSIEKAVQTKIKLSEDFTRLPIGSLLRKAGFNDTLLIQIENTPAWDKIKSLKLPHAIAEFSRWLGSEFRKVEVPELTSRIAFIGTPGAGKTMTLCKVLAEHVFLHSKSAKVLKLEAETPNPDDVLSIFCETLGVELLRDPEELQAVPKNETVYIDLPGIAVTDSKGWTDLDQQLTSLNIQTRILVINAAYDCTLIKNILEQGQKINATHLVLTHVDELISKTRLWNFTIQSRIPTLYFSYGQNITGDISNNTLEYLSDQTFSSILTNVN